MNNSQHDSYMKLRTMLFHAWQEAVERNGKDKIDDIVKDLRRTYMVLNYKYKRGQI